MLPKNRRLTRQQFWKVIKEGRNIQYSIFNIRFLPNEVGFSRFAVVVSSRLAKRAVDRNRLRRKIYRLLSIGHWTLNIDVVLFPQRPVLNLDDDKLGASLDQVLSKIPRRS